MKKLFYLLISALFTLNSCEKACTDEFVMITLTVEDQQGNPISLDDAYTIRVSTGDTTRRLDMQYANFYVVVTDNMQPELNGKTEDFRFEGILNNVKVIEEIYKITADDCHISKVSGAAKVVLD